MAEAGEKAEPAMASPSQASSKPKSGLDAEADKDMSPEAPNKPQKNSLDQNKSDGEESDNDDGSDVERNGHRSGREASLSSKSCRWGSCTLRFESAAQAREHEKVDHLLQGGTKCEIIGCGKVFSQHQKLTRHFVAHGERQFACSHCGSKFFYRWDLKRHTFLHTGLRPFKCPEIGCAKSYTKQTSLEIHLINDHGKSKSDAQRGARRSAPRDSANKSAQHDPEKGSRSNASRGRRASKHPKFDSSTDSDDDDGDNDEDEEEDVHEGEDDEFDDGRAPRPAKSSSARSKKKTTGPASSPSSDSSESSSSNESDPGNANKKQLRQGVEQVSDRLVMLPSQDLYDPSQQYYLHPGLPGTVSAFIPVTAAHNPFFPQLMPSPASAVFVPHPGAAGVSLVQSEAGVMQIPFVTQGVSPTTQSIYHSHQLPFVTTEAGFVLAPGQQQDRVRNRHGAQHMQTPAFTYVAQQVFERTPQQVSYPRHIMTPGLNPAASAPQGAGRPYHQQLQSYTEFAHNPHAWSQQKKPPPPW